ncbi:MAG: replicative DNA helicase [Ruminococcaceae bacterium]|nr:replicative DNA helicase [Oscillospiraceae bacterium]
MSINEQNTPDVLDRKLPFSLVAEQSLLGAVLVSPESFNLIADVVSANDFYMEEHKQIFMAMHELFLTSSQIDVVTLIDMLVQKGVYSKSGGEQYIRTILEVVPNALNVKDYARIVKDKSVLRQLITASDEVANMAYSEQDDVAHILDSAENKIFSIAQGKDTKNFRHIRDVLNDVYAHLDDLKNNKEASQGVPTGFSGLDKVLAGMSQSDLVLVGARPGMGKTSFCLNIAANVAAQTGKKVCIFSLEMSAEQLVNRMVSSEAMVDSYKLRTGELTPEDWENVAHAAAHLAKCDILIDDTAGITVTGMKAKLRRVKDLGLVVIDYLQLMQGDKHTDNRVQEVGDISRGMKLLAKELMVPVICCSQLNRGVEGRSDKRPMMSDLRESGTIEQDADVILLLFRDEYYKVNESAVPNTDAESNIVEVIVAKNRHGSTATVKMGWIGRYTKFRSIADESRLPQ